MKKILLPPSKIGVIGGGQLGRMFAFEAKRMGYDVYVLDPKENSPAGQVCDEQIVADFDDFEALLNIAKKTDVLTFEFEHINTEHLLRLKNMGYKIFPSPEALRIIQNKYLQKEHLKKCNLPVPKFDKVNSFEELILMSGKYGFPFILKFSRGGYDGKGNIKIENMNDLNNFRDFDFDKEMFIEELINFKKEISVIVCKNNDEEFKYYPVFENYHEESILKITKCPADISYELKVKAVDIAKKVIESFNDVGLYCIEMFIDDRDEIYINEIAPRPHNSGHLTIEANVTSQFENHLRSITNLPLGSTEIIKSAVMINIIGDKKIKGRYTIKSLPEIVSLDGVYVHLYGKAFTDKNKKIGHITIVDDLEERLNKKKDYILNILKIGDFNE